MPNLAGLETSVETTRHAEVSRPMPYFLLPLAMYPLAERARPAPASPSTTGSGATYLASVSGRQSGGTQADSIDEGIPRLTVIAQKQTASAEVIQPFATECNRSRHPRDSSSAPGQESYQAISQIACPRQKPIWL